MKSKKKVGLVKRIAAGVCAVMLVVSSMGVSSFYYGATDYLALFFDNREMAVDSEFTIYDIPLTDKMLEYKYLALFCSDDYQYYYAICSNEPFELVFDVDRLAFYGSAYDTEGYVPVISYYRTADSEWKTSNLSTFNLLEITKVDDKPIVKNGRCNYIFSNFPLYCGDYLFFDNGSVGSDGAGSYNSSLGYLKNVQRKNLTIDGENYDPDYDSWQVMFTFDSTSTTGLDITAGGYSVRHFMNWEVRDRDSDVVRSYDKVSCGEYDAASCKISYPLYSTRQAAMEESGFEALSWWEAGILGYEVYIYDYLQLVRTNEDGSVEYGGYVRIDESGCVADTLDDNFTEDSGGYLDKNVSNSFGSGSNYEDAEHDADENASNSSNPNGDALGELNNILSTISAVPEAFTRMFAFLPDWCLNSIGISVVAGFAIIIWKVGRG